MKRMFRTGIAILAVVIMMIFQPATASAEEIQIPDSLISSSGADDITDSLEPEIQDILEKYGIEAGNPDAAGNTGVWDVLSSVLDDIASQLSAPLKIFTVLTAAAAFSGIMGAVHGGLRNSAEQISSMITAMAGAAAVVPAVSGSFLRVKETLVQCTDFMTAFTPVFAGIVITGGNAGTGISYYTAVYALVSIVMQVTGNVLLPVLSMCLALAVSDAVSPSVNMGGILRFFKSLVTWSLGFLMTIFLGVLSVQGIVRSAADTFTTKTARFVVSNFVPFVGGAVSDAYSTVLGSLRILRSTTGFVGIAAVCILFLPVLIELVLCRFAVSGAAAVSELFAADTITRLLRGIEVTLQMTLAVLICFTVMFLVAIALVLMVSTGSYGG